MYCLFVFNRFSEYASRLEKVCQNKFTDIFVSKDICVWFAVFDRFTKLGSPKSVPSDTKVNCNKTKSHGKNTAGCSYFDDSRFADFIQELIDKLHDKEIHNITYDELSRKSGTKDKKIITEKIDTLCALMIEYLYS